MSCLSCLRGFHDECDASPCCCPDTTSDSSNSSDDREPDRREPKMERTNVSVSAGRKRAARLYEIDPKAPCDWRGLANCGGGFVPIVGCIVGFQTDRQHGPDKDTTNNSPENVHLICKPCHNLWHRRNDPLYAGETNPEGIEPHNPRWATLDELMSREHD